MMVPCLDRTRARAVSQLGFAAALLAMACSGASLDASDSTTRGIGEATSAGSSGAAQTGSTGDDPGDPARGCALDCSVRLSPTWTYEGQPDPGELAAPGPHRAGVVALVAAPDGGWFVGEQRPHGAVLHRIDIDGAWKWQRPVPLPCGDCQLGDLTLDDSGDLLLSATGFAVDGRFSLIAGRWDPVADALRWSSALPLEYADGTALGAGAGGIVRATQSLVVQAYTFVETDLIGLERTARAVYGVGGTFVDSQTLDTTPIVEPRVRPMLRMSVTGELVMGRSIGSTEAPSGQILRFHPPVWSFGGDSVVPGSLDGLVLDAREHEITLSHSFDGDTIRQVLSDRAASDSQAEWVATASTPSRTEALGALARGDDGHLYTAQPTTRTFVGDPDAPPVLAVVLHRWSGLGEMIWSQSILLDRDVDSIALQVDATDALIVAFIRQGAVRVERWEQQCDC